MRAAGCGEPIRRSGDSSVTDQYLQRSGLVTGRSDHRTGCVRPVREQVLSDPVHERTRRFLARVVAAGRPS